MFYGDIESVCCQGQWIFIGDSLSGRKVASIQEDMEPNGGTFYQDYVLSGADGIIAKFENCQVEEHVEDGILTRIDVNGRSYSLGEIVNGRTVMQIVLHQERAPYARIPAFKFLDSDGKPIPHRLPNPAVEVWYQPFEPF